MAKPLFVRPFSDAEHMAITTGLRAADAFTLRRCQILRASATGATAPVIAAQLHCSGQTVRTVIRRFNQDGIAVFQAGSSVARHRPHTAFPPATHAPFLALVRRSPRTFGKHQTQWSRALLADVCFAEGLTSRRVSGEAVRATLARLGVAWIRAKQWITSPDLAYTAKKNDATD